MDVKLLLWSALGGITPDLTRLVKAGALGAPSYLKSWFFWVSFIILALLGVAAAYLMPATNEKQAFAFGFSAPEILSRLAAKQDADRKVGDFTLRTWWAA